MGFLCKDKDLHGYISNQTSMLPVFEWFSTLPVIEKFIRLPGISQLAMPTPNDKTGAGLLIRLDSYHYRRGCCPINNPGDRGTERLI
jgi:hypothetical protein